MKQKDIYSRKRHQRMKERRYKKTAIGMSVAALLVAGLAIGDSVSLLQKNEKYKAQEEELQEQLVKEDERAAEIEELSKRVEEKEYIEYVGRNHLGLAYEDEILFRAR